MCVVLQLKLISGTTKLKTRPPKICCLGKHVQTKKHSREAPEQKKVNHLVQDVKEKAFVSERSEGLRSHQGAAMKWP